MIGLSGKVALVTGSAQGIGAGISRVLNSYGMKVAIVDQQTEKGAALAAELSSSGTPARFVESDLSTDAGCAAAITGTVDALGGLDVIVNNAAPGRDRDRIGELSGSDWDGHADLVLRAVTRLADHGLVHLARSSSPAIVNVSSTTAVSIAEEQCTWPYHVSKAGLEQLTRYLACRLGEHGIRVNAVAPGLVDRDAGRKLSDDPAAAGVIQATVPLGRAGSSSEVGQAVAFLSSDAASYVTGQILTLDGGLGLREVFGAASSARG